MKMNPKKTPPIDGRGTIALIDAFSLFFKAFYAIRGLTNDDGLPTNAVYGFIRMMQKLLNERAPEYIAVALESPTVTFRSEIHDGYKANRTAPPSDLLQQIPWLKKACNAWGLTTIEHEGYEADDIIGTLARMAERDGHNVWIVSADKDLFQLVTEKIQFLRFEGNDLEVYGPEQVAEKMGVRPDQMVDFLALVGDSSDNIPGVPKIGPKSAVDLLREFGSLEAIYSDVSRVKNKRWRELLQAGEDSARLSRRLACICETIPLQFEWDNLRWHGRRSTPAFTEVCRELGFKTLVQQGEQDAARDAQMPLELFIDEDRPTPPKPTSTQYTLISTEQELAALVERIRTASMLSLDVETASRNFPRGELVGISLCFSPGEAFYIPLGHRLMGDETRQLPLSTVRSILGPVLCDSSIPKTGHNLKDDMKVLLRNDLPLKGITFDTAIAQYLLDPEANQSLADLSTRLLQVEHAPISGLLGTGKAQLLLSDVPVESACDYACQDADMALRLTDCLSQDLKRAELDDLMKSIEIPLLTVLAEMEIEGVRLDVGYLRQLSGRMHSQLNALRQQIYAEACREFNISSTRQVADLLFNQLGLKPLKSGKEGYSTDLATLESLADQHPLPNLIVQYRAYEKLLSTYVDSLPQLVHEQTGRLHCSFSQTIAATGRLSCSDPNLQNIPVRSEDGKAIRKAFLPNREGEVLLAADYSQIELRVLAHLSQDEALISAFQRDVDIHLDTASRIFRCDPANVTSLMRSQAKVVNFGVLYGMTAMRLSNEFKISRQAAQQFIEDYFAAYPRVRAWIQKTIEDGRRLGYVRTLSGRKRLLPALIAPSHNARKAAERVATNTPVQGTAADMIKIAMIRIQEKLRESPLRGRMILQIHDELMFTTPADEVPQLEQLVRREMENALPLDVPVKVNVCSGDNWAEV